MLTDKAKEDFIKWLNQQEIAPYAVMFDELPINIKQMYIIEFFDFAGIYIEASMHNCKKFWCDVCYFETNEDFNSDFSLIDEIGNQLYFEDRKSAVNKGIDKSNEIYNLRCADVKSQ